jgi:Polyketide cyclase / dehydrase and lipid transport
MISVSVSQAIKAPREAVMALYADYRNWDRLFPLIRGVRFVRQEGDRTVLDIDHVEGHVPNVLRQVSPETVELWEDKRKYSGTFRNTFQAAPEGTNYTVEARIQLKGIYRLLGPFVGGYIRAKISRYVIEPLKAVAEGRLT